MNQDTNKTSYETTDVRDQAIQAVQDMKKSLERNGACSDVAAVMIAASILELAEEVRRLRKQIRGSGS
ncbi:MAG: hypothetical protein ACLQVX_09715 [Limisphaerales bacterium]|jgi:hypothetical protein